MVIPTRAPYSLEHKVLRTGVSESSVGSERSSAVHPGPNRGYAIGTRGGDEILDACAHNRESAGCLSQDAQRIRRPDAITPDMVDPHPTSSVSLYSEDSWRRYWTDRFAALGSALAPLVFAHLESKDANPGDGYLDLSSVPRESAEFVFDHLHPFDGDPRTTQKALDAIRRDVVQTQRRLMSLYVVKVGGQFVGVTETGMMRALVGDDLQRAWDGMRKVYPDQEVARVVVDGRFFVGREQNGLNPDRKGIWAPLLYHNANIAVSGGMGVFDATREISAVPYSTRMAGLGPSDLDNFITVLSVALLIVALFRRGGAASGPVMALEPGARSGGPRFDMDPSVGLAARVKQALTTRGRGFPNLFMSTVGRAVRRALSGPAPEPPRNEPYQVPEGITVRNTPVVSRSYSDGTMTMRPVSRDERVVYAVDTAGPRPREGFAMMREGEGREPLFIPIRLVRMAVLNGEVAQTPFRPPYEMPSIPFRDPETRKFFHVSPSWNLNPYPGRIFDPHAQIVGVVVKDGRGKPVVSLPWVDGWMQHSPMTYEPLRQSPHGWVVPGGWGGGHMTWSRRTEAAAALLDKLPQMTYLQPEQRAALAMVAAAVASPRMDAGMARRAVNAVMQGRRSTTYLADQVADALYRFPMEWAFNFSRKSDAREALTPEMIQTIETCVTQTHDVFPALSDAIFLFPRPELQRTTLPPHPMDVVRP